MRHILFRVGSLAFAIGALTLAVVHGCSKPQPAVSAVPEESAMGADAAPATAPPSAAQVEEAPTYLGATKAAVIVKPKPAASQKNQK